MTDKKLNVVNCKFKFQCHKKWEDLIYTDDEAIRHCPKCDKDVYLSRTVDEINKHIKMNVCMAIPLNEDESDEPYSGHILGQVEGDTEYNV